MVTWTSALRRQRRRPCCAATARSSVRRGTRPSPVVREPQLRADRGDGLERRGSRPRAPAAWPGGGVRLRVPARYPRRRSRSGRRQPRPRPPRPTSFFVWAATAPRYTGAAEQSCPNDESVIAGSFTGHPGARMVPSGGRPCGSWSSRTKRASARSSPEAWRPRVTRSRAPADGYAGLALALGRRCDLVVLDLLLPGLDGLRGAA